MSDDIGRPERMMTRRKFGLGLAFASVAGVAAARLPNKNLDYLGKQKLESVIPDKIGRWNYVSSSGLVVPPEDQMIRALYSQLVTRVYSDGSGPPIMLLVAQSATQTGILQIHRPEICYTAGGYQLSAIEPHVVGLPWGALPTLSMSATSDSRTEQLVYWTRIGDRLPKSWREQRMVVAMDNLRRIIPDAIMVRVSTFGNDKARALASMDEFILSLMNSVSPQVRRVFIA
ncbi:EpsI family protein [Sphingomonas sediminicola]|uniref:EpsI family protein n=1 Tax=Sphingomonas sediminicola TaxID=386874 RepID=A0ABX6T9S3_9SPHN|nr:exosortase-associated protein EpsI, V-type [Sphingomonas sediminicola]QNP46141.1 EpsI family protein [Sphingomonas sediminicola]